MVHPTGLTDKAVTDILLNSESEEDFGSDNNNELSESERKYRSQSDSGAEDILPMASVDATTTWKKTKGGRETPHVHLMTSLHRNLFMEFQA
jgi:hypothetical protein